MARVYSLILLLCAGVLVGPASHAQGRRASTTVRTAGTVANLFETLDPSSPVHGVRLRLPEEWDVQDIHLLRYGTIPVPVRYRAEEGTVLLTAERPIQGPHELLLRVEVGPNPGMFQWRLTPFIESKDAESDSLAQRRFLTVDRVSRRVQIKRPARPDGPNRAADLNGTVRSLPFRLPSHVRLGREASFTIEFWMRTSGLDEILLSTWTGEEAVSYPAEFVVDQSGRLRFYSGQSGTHQALRTKMPVADDRWHHAAVIYDKTTSRLRLLLDGSVVDSGRARVLPASPAEGAVALGGRLSQQADNATPQKRYTGRIDELRIWPGARSEATIRQMKGRPFAVQGPETGPGPFRLSFDDPLETERVEVPQGIRRVPTVLSFRSPLRDLRAQTEGRSVTLRWQAESAEAGTFVVERSLDGVSFTTVARLNPSEAGASSQTQEIVYTDEDAPGNVVYYRIRQVQTGEEIERVTGTIKVGLGAEVRDERAIELVGNFPNPFETSTRVAYRVKKTQPLTLTVWDLSGKQVATLADGVHAPGYYEKALRAGDLPSGPYFARLETDQGVQSHRMVLLK